MEKSAQDEIDQVSMGRPHVVILGAGASRATCLGGDKFGRVLPLMADFARVLELGTLLESWGCDPEANFEDTYSELFDLGDAERLTELEDRVEKYFEKLELPDVPTVYDHLLLSLREKDIVATFNWDPLLMQAYRRNCRRFPLPKLAFLHGNIRAGYCLEHRTTGVVGTACSRCKRPFERSRLLYPVKHKDYSTDPFIADQWALLEWGLKNAFMITPFGYGAPKTDVEAMQAMSTAWGTPDERQLEQTEVITVQPEDEARAAWDHFIHSHHYDVLPDFYESWIAKHPRRTGEAYLNQYLEAEFIADNPVPRDRDFPALWDWYEELRTAELTASPLKGPPS
jgi:hypothetical protein